MPLISITNLPPPPAYFVDRAQELTHLQEFWTSRKPPVLAIVGLGGMGKTALVSEFVGRITRGDLERPDTLFIWSFYKDRGVGSLFQAICQMFEESVSSDADGVLLERALRYLSKAGRTLVVLDGLEAAQHLPGLAGGGAIENMLLERFLAAIATGRSGIQSLITTRIDPTIPGVRILQLPGISPADAEGLLRYFGVTGTPEEFQRAASELGGLPLALAMFGSTLAQTGGDLNRGLDLLRGGLSIERSLTTLLKSLDARLTDVERALLSRISLSEETPTVRAYSSLLEAALRIDPRPPEIEELTKSRPRVFLSYVREDATMVGRLKDDLEKNGIDAWQDTDRLIPGRRWKQEIRRAIKSGDFFIACFSQSYTARDRTYMNEELLVAIEEMRLRPSDRSWFIPTLLTPSAIPDIPIGPGESLRDLHWVELYGDWDKSVALLARALT